MKNSLYKILSNYIDSDKEIEEKLLTLFLYSIIICGFVSIGISFCLRFSLISKVMLLSSICVAAFVLFIEQKLKKHKLAAIITCFGSLASFSFLFFLCGGIQSGMILWILLVLLTPFVFLKGKISLVVFGFCAPAIIFVIIFSVLRPDLVTVVDSKLKIGIDVSQSMIFVSIIINAMYKFQISSNKRQNEKIKKSYEEIKKATEAKSIFLSNMSHDIRTPMNAIIGFTRLATKNIDDKENVKESLDRILTSSEYLLTLINDVLDMQKIEKGKIEISKIKFNLGKTITDIQKILVYQIQSKNIKVNINFTDLKHYLIENDLILIKKILMNIFSNAVNYSKEEGGSIYIKITEKEIDLDKKLSEYTISIKDQGKGMSPEFVEKVFEPFEREKDTTISGIIGTGLGLAITKSSVDLLGGTIDVKSQLGVGSEFIVKFYSNYYEEAEHVVSEYENNITFEGKHVLLVEDNEMNRVIASGILTDIGFTVEFAENGQQAVDMVTSTVKRKYDLIYMDIMMPILNGYDATDKIRHCGNPVIENVPIIAMTANAFADDVKKAHDFGMNGHIAKPLSIEEIVRVSKDVLNCAQNQ